MKTCPVCGHANRPAARACDACGEPLPAGPAGRDRNRDPEDLFEDDLDEELEPAGDLTGDSTGGVIPYKNPSALIAYYLGLFSGFPLIGLPLGLAAFVLGIMGLRARRANPAVKGAVHAWIGIGCGGLFALLWTLAAVGILIAVLNNR